MSVRSNAVSPSPLSPASTSAGPPVVARYYDDVLMFAYLVAAKAKAADGPL